MKRCPACGTVSLDSKVVCDACGADISDVPVESMEKIALDLKDESRRTKAVDDKAFKKLKIRALVALVVVLISVIGVELAGLYLVIVQGNRAGIALVILGFLMVIAGWGNSLAPARRRF